MFHDLWRITAPDQASDHSDSSDGASRQPKGRSTAFFTITADRYRYRHVIARK